MSSKGHRTSTPTPFESMRFHFLGFSGDGSHPDPRIRAGEKTREWDGKGKGNGRGSCSDRKPAGLTGSRICSCLFDFSGTLSRKQCEKTANDKFNG